eukprot:2097635-Prymnesium_polylepis.1
MSTAAQNRAGRAHQSVGGLWATAPAERSLRGWGGGVLVRIQSGRRREGGGIAGVRRAARTVCRAPSLGRDCLVLGEPVLRVLVRLEHNEVGEQLVRQLDHLRWLSGGGALALPRRPPVVLLVARSDRT